MWETFQISRKIPRDFEIVVPKKSTFSQFYSIEERPLMKAKRNEKIYGRLYRFFYCKGTATDYRCNHLLCDCTLTQAAHTWAKWCLLVSLQCSSFIYGYFIQIQISCITRLGFIGGKVERNKIRLEPLECCNLMHNLSISDAYSRRLGEF